MPDKVIFHVDVNSAFLSWSAIKLLKEGYHTDLREIPSAVGGDASQRKGIILAKSVSAKKYGVKTGEPIWEARKKCPRLVIVPGDYDYYSKMSNRFMDVARDFSPICEQYSVDECFIDYTGMEHLLGAPEDAAAALKERIWKELGFTVSIGIAPNKILAKMASDLRKPDFITTLYQNELEEKMWPLSVEELFMVGGATKRKLNSVGIWTIGQLAKSSLPDMEHLLGVHGKGIWLYANGIDDSPVRDVELSAPKSFSQSATLPKNITTADAAKADLSRLCTALAYRMRRHQMCAQVVSVYLRRDDFQGFARQHRLARATDISRELTEACYQLFDGLWSGFPIRAIGIGFSDLSPVECFCLSLFDRRETARFIKLDEVGDSLRDRYGHKTLLPLTDLGANRFDHLSRYAPNSDRPATRCPFS